MLSVHASLCTLCSLCLVLPPCFTAYGFMPFFCVPFATRLEARGLGGYTPMRVANTPRRRSTATTLCAFASFCLRCSCVGDEDLNPVATTIVACGFPAMGFRMVPRALRACVLKRRSGFGRTFARKVARCSRRAGTGHVEMLTSKGPRSPRWQI